MGYPLRKMNILGYIPIVEQTNIYNIYIYKHKSIFDTICLSNLAMENGKFLYDLLVKRIHSYLWITAGPPDITPIALASPPRPNQDSPFSDATPSPASRASRHTRRSGRSVARSSSYAGGATVTSPESRNPRGLRNGGEGLGDDLGNHLIHV